MSITLFHCQDIFQSFFFIIEGEKKPFFQSNLANSKVYQSLPYNGWVRIEIQNVYFGSIKLELNLDFGPNANQPYL